VQFNAAADGCFKVKGRDPMKTLRTVLQEAQARGDAVGQFNVSDMVLL
jgi:hypothetical protein